MPLPFGVCRMSRYTLKVSGLINWSISVRGHCAQLRLIFSPKVIVRLPHRMGAQHNLSQAAAHDAGSVRCWWGRTAHV